MFLAVCAQTKTVSVVSEQQRTSCFSVWLLTHWKETQSKAGGVCLISFWFRNLFVKPPNRRNKNLYVLVLFSPRLFSLRSFISVTRSHSVHMLEVSCRFSALFLFALRLLARSLIPLSMFCEQGAGVCVFLPVGRLVLLC